MKHEKIQGGYILQPRAWDDSEAAHFPPVVREVWFWLLRNVSHKGHKTCRRGEGFFTLKDLQDGLSWHVGYRKETYSKPQLTKSLRRLREEHMIETTKETRGIRISVINYEFYQSPENYEGNDERNTKATRRKREGHTIDKNEEEWKNVQEEKKKSKRGFTAPDVRDVVEYFVSRGSTEQEAVLYHDYYTANGWMVGRAKMKDWQAAARTWINRNNTRQPNRKQHVTTERSTEGGAPDFGARNLDRLEGLFTGTQG